MNWNRLRTAGPIFLAAALSAASAAAAGPGDGQGTDRAAGDDRSGESGTRLSPIKITDESARESDAYINLDKSAQVGKTPVPVKDTPQAIEIVERDFMEDIGALTIEDALLYSAGIQGAQFGFDNRVDTVAVRGLDASRYLDGLRSVYGYYNSVLTNPYTLERLEVLKGPSSVLYGQAELGGIINAVSKLPRDEQQGELWAQAGSFDRRQIAADVTGPITRDGDWLYRVVALNRDTDTQVDHVENDGYLMAPSVTWKPDNRTEVSLLVNRLVNDGRVAPQFLPSKGTIDPAPKGRIPTDTFVGEPGWDRYDRERTDVTLFVDQRLTDNWQLKATVRKSDSEAETREHWIAIGAVPDDDGNVARTIYTVDRETDVLNFDVRAQGVIDLGPTVHTLAIGVDRQDALWEEDNYYYGAGQGGTINLYDPQYGNLQDQALNPVDRPDSEIKQTGIYLIDHIEIDRVVVSAALRRDDSESTTLNPGAADVTSDDEVTTGRLGLMYRFDSGLSPYVSYAESFNPNLGTDQAGGTLEPTEGDQTEIGLKYLSRRHAMSVDFAWFDIEQTNRVVQGNRPGGVTQTGAVVDGWEIQLKKRFGGLELLANYTDLDARDESTGFRLSNVAEELASLWGKYEFDNGFRVGAGARYRGDVVGSGGGPEVASVTVYDAMLGYRTGPWDFSVNGHNLADKVYVTWCRAEGLDCGYGSRRNIVGNVRYRF